MEESCILCGCKVHRSGEYATKTLTGRSHATFHHYVAERFFGRSQNRKGTLHVPIFTSCPWDLEKKGEIYCYECPLPRSTTQFVPRSFPHSVAWGCWSWAEAARPRR